MASKVAVSTDKAPKPLPGIYSQAIKANGMVFVSGAIALDAETGKLVDGDVQAHTVSFSTNLISSAVLWKSTMLTSPPAPMHQKPLCHPRSRWLQH